jgi:exodeoxyribonuclease VII small subunit
MATDHSLAAAPGAADGPGFDQVLERLRTVVERLEQGNLSLEESLKIFEEGVSLARKGHTLLEAAEKRVEVLVRSPGGVDADVAVPFERAPGAG